ncbi:unnamed protein product, partial [Ilex paraguariensis]
MACKKTSQEWEYAIEVLNKYAVQFPGMENEVFRPLHFSDESLPNATVRSCFLYCSLYPEDSKIIVGDLINKWIDEGFLNDGAENQGSSSNVLLEKVSNNTVKMHDVIREMTLWIGREYEEQLDKFLVRAGGRETEAPEVSKWKEVKRMSLM